jgi:hypothetical protein
LGGGGFSRGEVFALAFYAGWLYLKIACQAPKQPMNYPARGGPRLSLTGAGARLHAPVCAMEDNAHLVDDGTVAALKARLASAAASGWGDCKYQSPDEWLPKWRESCQRDFEEWHAQWQASHPEPDPDEVKGPNAAKPERKRRERKPTLASVAKQASKAGVVVARYEVEPGKITVVTGKPGEANGGTVNEWDEVFNGDDQASIR